MNAANSFNLLLILIYSFKMYTHKKEFEGRGFRCMLYWYRSRFSNVVSIVFVSFCVICIDFYEMFCYSNTASTHWIPAESEWLYVCMCELKAKENDVLWFIYYCFQFFIHWIWSILYLFSQWMHDKLFISVLSWSGSHDSLFT